MSNNLNDKAMLIRLSIGSWTARKYDKAVSDKVNDEYAADRDAGRYNKVLVAQDEIKKIQKIVNTARTFHYENTLPWDDSDNRMLPAANYLSYCEKMRSLRAEFERAVESFIYSYPALIEDAKLKLNGMFNHADYPDAARIRGKYSFEFSVSPLPYSDDFRVNLSNDEVKRIQDEITERVQGAANTAMKDLWQRLYEVVKHMAGKLSDKDSIFRNSLIENITDLCALLPKLNVFADPDLENLRRDVELKLTGYNPDVIRNNPDERDAAAKDAADLTSKIENAMAGYFGGAV